MVHMHPQMSLQLPTTRTPLHNPRSHRSPINRLRLSRIPQEMHIIRFHRNLTVAMVYHRLPRLMAPRSLRHRPRRRHPGVARTEGGMTRRLSLTDARPAVL